MPKELDFALFRKRKGSLGDMLAWGLRMSLPNTIFREDFSLKNERTERWVEEKEAGSCLLHRHFKGFPLAQKAGEGGGWEQRGGGGRVKTTLQDPLGLRSFLGHRVHS